MPIRPEKLAPHHRIVVRRANRADDVPIGTDYVVEVCPNGVTERTIAVRAALAAFYTYDREIGAALKLNEWSANRFDTVSPASRDAGIQRLARAGAALLDALAKNEAHHDPREWPADDLHYLTTFLADLGDNEIVEIDCNVLPICWTFLHLGDPHVRAGDPLSGFVGARCRLIIGPIDTRPPPLRMIGLTLARKFSRGPAQRMGFVDDSTVKTAAQHRQYLSAWMGAGFEPLHPDTPAVSLQDVDELAEYLTRGLRQATHFVCHGEASYRSATSHQLQVRSGVMVPTRALLQKIDDIGRKIGSSAPGRRNSTLRQRLVAVHVCESSLPSEPPDHFSIVEGLVRKGARCGVGVVAQICEGNALAFSEALYDTLQTSPGPIGEAFFAAHRRMLQTGNPAFLSYVFAGDPEATL